MIVMKEEQHCEVSGMHVIHGVSEILLCLL